MSNIELKTNVPLGRSRIQVSAPSVRGLFMISGFFAQIPQKCGNCNSDNLVLAGYKNSGYEFYNVLCLDCKYRLRFGQKKEDNSLFLREDAAFEPPHQPSGNQQQGGGGGNQQQQPPQQGGGGGGGGYDDDIPF